MIKGTSNHIIKSNYFEVKVPQKLYIGKLSRVICILKMSGIIFPGSVLMIQQYLRIYNKYVIAT